MMFSGEALCLIPYFLLRWRKRTIKAQQGILNNKPPMPRTFVVKRVAAFAIPTVCDATATTLLNIGLFYTFASTFQMLRGTLVLFAGCLTILILRRRLYLHHWLGMVLIAAGAAIVGFASVVQSNRHYPPHHHRWLPPPAMSSPGESILGVGMQQQGSLDMGSEDMGGGVLPEADVPLTGRSLMDSHWLVRGLHTLRKGGSSSGSSSSSTDGWGSGQGDLNGDVRGEGWLHAGAPVLPIVGDTLVVLAQLFAAAQFILEEKFLAKYRMQPLLAVGVEGAWGVVLSLCALPLLGSMQAPNGLPLEDASAAFQAMARMPDLRNAVILSVVSIGAFNWFGLSVTQALSGASRATIDACRTMLVWFFSLAAGWETFHELQVLGFIVLISEDVLKEGGSHHVHRTSEAPPAAPRRTTITATFWHVAYAWATTC
ncbi:hypothetical protein DUNSADRAFT_4464 [Dunaliella salina]|uniref:EamA domain-containing protein n=1 Tax=Dunaliella salina TaxID=3046 RepID=A0ABQ7GRY4_DUNSA|nr:hypothetical protein DUNSADRAFT_4464 [Dunaliella salina]|eukprot:KAF5837360.1 hypothetical protein DUNSADRAFT_4464 [Dunaliella salina]